MKVALTVRDRIAIILFELEKPISIEEKYRLLEQFREQAAMAGTESAEAVFKLESRERTAKFLSRWFLWVNILTFSIVGFSFVFEVWQNRLGSGIVTSTVLISLIGATIAQTAAAFLIYIKYAFDLSVRPNKDKSEVAKKGNVKASREMSD